MSSHSSLLCMELGGSHIINQSMCAISLVNNSKNHAFLILEKLGDEQFTIDVKAAHLTNAGSGEANIIIKSAEEELLSSLNNKPHISWGINRRQYDKIVDDILSDQQLAARTEPPVLRYRLSGGEPNQSSKIKLHNCLSWAESILYKANLPYEASGTPFIYNPRSRIPSSTPIMTHD